MCLFGFKKQNLMFVPIFAEKPTFWTPRAWNFAVLTNPYMYDLTTSVRPLRHDCCILYPFNIQKIHETVCVSQQFWDCATTTPEIDLLSTKDSITGLARADPVRNTMWNLVSTTRNPRLRDTLSWLNSSMWQTDGRTDRREAGTSCS